LGASIVLRQIDLFESVFEIAILLIVASAIMLLLILIMRYRGWRLGFIATPSRIVAPSANSIAHSSERLLRDAIENISDGFVLYDSDNKFVMCNDKFFDIYPWCRDICVPGLPFLEMARAGLELGKYPQGRDNAQAWINQRLTEHYDFDNSFQRQLADGRWIMVRNRPTSDGGIVGIRTDITELKKSELALLRSEEDFRQLAESSIQGIIISNAARKPIFVNQQCVEMLGYRDTQEMLEAADVMDFVAVHDRARLTKQREDPTDQNQNQVSLEFDAERKDGTQVHVMSHSGNMLWRGQPCRFSAFQDVTEQRAAERLLREAIESLSEGFALFDHEDRLSLFNQRYLELYDQSGDAIQVGRKYEEMVRIAAASGQFPDAVGRVEEWVADRLRAHRDIPKISEQQLSDGRWLRISEFATPSGGIGGLRTDITEEKQALAEIKKGEARLRAIAENIAMPLTITGKTDGQILYANQASADFAGVTLAEMKTRNIVNNWVDPAARSDFIEALDRDGHVDRLEMHIRRAGGGADADTWVLCSASLIEFDDVSAVLAIYTDVTEQKLSEAALRESEAKLTAMVEIAPEGVISLDADLNIALFNRGAERIFGHEASEILGQKLDLLIPERFHLRHGDFVEQFRNAEDDTLLMSQRSDIAGLRADGSEFSAEASVSKVRIGDQLMYTVIIQDISERKIIEAEIAQAHENAEAANRAKSDFLANMSHELRTPLNAILGFSEIIVNQSYGPITEKKYLEYAGDIHDAGDLLLELINDVLDLAKIEAGQLSLIKHDVDLNTTIESTIRMIKEQVYAKHLALEIDLDASSPTIQGDERALRQIVLNLLSNAIKFTPDGGRITVSSVVESGGAVVVTVADTGIGIASADISKVLDPFGQVTAVDTREHKGTGLGLSLSKELTELHGAAFDFESEIGAGTVVRLKFPPEIVR